jgi:hypothetical protein
MKGGDPLGINDATLGNLIIALVNFKYYIKCKMNTKIYYFVFDLSKNNNMVNDYGVSKKLIENANELESLSKALLDLNVSNEEFYKIFTGEVYDEEESQVNGDKIILSKNGAKKATLTIAADTNYVISYQLNIGETAISSQIIQSTEKLGKATLSECTEDNYNSGIELIKNNVNSYKSTNEYKLIEIITELEKLTFNCGQEIISKLSPSDQEKMYNELTNSDNFLFVSDQPNILNSYFFLVENVGLALGKNPEELSQIKRQLKEKINLQMKNLEKTLLKNKSSPEDLSPIINYISSMNYFGKQNFIITSELINLILNSLGNIVSKEGSQTILKNVYYGNNETPVNSDTFKKFVEQIFVQLQKQFINDKLIQERDREIISERVYFYILFVVLSLIEIIKRGTAFKPGIHLLSSYQIDILLNEINKKINSINDESFKTYIEKNSYKKDVSDIVNEYIQTYKEFRESNKSKNEEFVPEDGTSSVSNLENIPVSEDKTSFVPEVETTTTSLPNLKNTSVPKRKRENETAEQIAEQNIILQQHITAAKEAENAAQNRINDHDNYMAIKKKIDGGGKLFSFSPNAVAIIENKSENLNFDEFVEPIIYLKTVGKKTRKDAVQIHSNQDENENAIFPYITIGKPLLLKLTEMLTNQRVSFEKPESTIKSIGKWILNNAMFAMQFSGLLFTLLSYAGTQYNIDALKNPEKVQEIAKNLTSIVASQNSTNSSGIFPTASNSDFMTSLPVNTNFTQSDPVNFNLGLNTTKRGNIEIGGRKTKKNKKYKKTRKNKKNKKNKNNKTKTTK